MKRHVKIQVIQVMRFIADKMVLPVCIVAMAATFALIVSYLFTGSENFTFIKAVTIFDIATIALSIVSFVCMAILHFIDEDLDEKFVKEKE